MNSISKVNLILAAIALVGLLGVWPHSVWALRQAPGTEPLQPAPQNIAPNYSGSIQTGTGAAQAGELNEQSPLQPDVFGGDESKNLGPGATNDVEVEVVDKSGGDMDLFSIFAGIMIVLVSAGIAAAYYLYRSGREVK